MPPRDTPARLALRPAWLACEIEVNNGRYRRASPERQAELRRDRQLQERERQDRERFIMQRAESRWQKSGVPSRQAWTDPDDMAGAPADMICAGQKLKTLIEDPRIVCLLGPRGCGKTTLAVGAVRYFCLMDRTVRFCRTMDVFRAIKGTWTSKRGQEDEEDAITKLAVVDLLVLDEVQVRGGTAWEDNNLADLIDRRYGDNRATILIANLRPADLLASLGESICSRLQEAGQIVECTWGSFRPNGKAISNTTGKLPPLKEVSQ
jgi:DNA replication protein DnaC